MRLFPEWPGDRESGERFECKHCNEYILCIEILLWIWACVYGVYGVYGIYGVYGVYGVCVRLFPQLSGLETEEVVKGVSANTAVHTSGYSSLKSYLGDGCGGGVQTISLCCLCSIHKSITLLEVFYSLCKRLHHLHVSPQDHLLTVIASCIVQSAEFACSVHKTVLFV